ncbi:MAG: GTPase, partial [Phormidesmis sp. RL_2_1]|nr:GTPase [Phormidesmis sp. RL_2_1]
MRRPYVLLAAVSVLIGLILLLSIVSSLGQLYSAIATLSPLLAQLILLLVILALLAALGILFYYGWLFLRPKRKRSITLPEQPNDVAAVSLQAAEQQVSQIEDEIARQALAE